jgi:hypothetical protein
LGAGIRLGVLLGQLTGMHHENAPCLLRHPPIAVLDLHGPDDTLSMPTAARCVLGTPRLFPEEGEGRLLRAPGFQGLAHRPGAGHQGPPAQALFPTPASRPSTLRLAIRHAPVDALQAQRAALLHGYRRLDTGTRLAIPHPEPQG